MIKAITAEMNIYIINNTSFDDKLYELFSQDKIFNINKGIMHYIAYK